MPDAGLPIIKSALSKSNRTQNDEFYNIMKDVNQFIVVMNTLPKYQQRKTDQTTANTRQNLYYCMPQSA